MVDQTKPCPNCRQVMDFRLGGYECPGCGHCDKTSNDQQDSGVGRGRPQQGTSAPGVSQYSSTTSLPSQRPQQPDNPSKPPSIDFSPTGKKEKLLLLGIFIIKGLYIASGAVGSEGFIATLAFEIFDVALIAFVLVLYGPFAPLKRACANYSCFVGIVFSAGLLVVGVMLTLSMQAFSGNEGTVILLWLKGCAEAFTHLWLASVLYRDIHNIQAR